jgi:U4/U6 small nuclear ribonucleoprotein PRP3
MLTRIKWEDEIIKDNEGNEVPNRCVLVWEVSAVETKFILALFDEI